ncbi:MAG: autotransporter domain-containing protein [Caulobacterales bacterium]|nr:autotransporter domain-containing protein [Caulobacterales bacterium]
MKRLFVSAALAPLLFAGVAQAETKISTATTTPVKTSTIASGQPDSITIDTTGTITSTAAGAAVTVDSSNAVTNNGGINFNNVSNATGIQINGGVATTVTNAGTIGVVEDYTATDTNSDGVADGPFAQGSGRYGIRATGAGDITGAILNSGAIQVEGNDSAGISIESRLVGSLTSSGSVAITGDRTIAVRADSVVGSVAISGTHTATGEGAVGVQLGDVTGAVTLQGSIVTTGYKTTTRLSDAARALLLPDDLKQGGAAVRITGNVGQGILLNSATTSGTTTIAAAALTSYGSAPALDIGSAAATTIGVVGGGLPAFGIINEGVVVSSGVNDGIAATALRIGQAGGGVTVQGGLYNVAGATVTAAAYGARATGLLINAGSSVPALHNAGVLGAEQNGGLHDARAVVDLSGSLTYLQNSGTIKATVTTPTGVTQTGHAVAIDLSANTTGATVRQMLVAGTETPSIGGEVRFGSGDDHLEILTGTLTGAVNFGAGADSLVIDGGATVTSAISDSDGRLSLDIRKGKLALANTGTLALTSFNLGASGVLAINIDPTSTAARLQVAGPATVASGAQIAISLTSLSRGTKSYQVIQAQSLSVSSAGLTLAGAPYLYQAALRSDPTAAALYVDLRPKTAAELGLNRSGSQAFAAVFDSLDKDPAVDQAFLSQTTQAGFNGLYDQMLPDHSGGVLMSAAALSQAVSSAVARPMAIDKTSGTGAWAQEITFSLQRDRDNALGYKSQGFGFAAGADLEGETNALGADVSFVTADVKDRGAAAGESLTMNVLGAGLYWRLDGGPLQAAVRGGLGYAFLKGDRRLISPTLNLQAKSSWNGWMADAYAGASYEWRLGGLYARPEASLSYVRLSEGSYDEKNGGAGFDLSVDSRTGDMLTGQALVALGYRFGDDTYWAPELTAGYRARIAGGPDSTTAHFQGGQDFTLDPEDVTKGGAIVRAGFRGGAARVLYEVNGGAMFDKSYQEYDVRAVVRFQF